MSYALSMIPEFYPVIDSIDSLMSPNGVIGVVDFYVQNQVDFMGRNYMGGAIDRHCMWLSRVFWRTWFEIDRVNLEPARRVCLVFIVTEQPLTCPRTISSTASELSSASMPEIVSLASSFPTTSGLVAPKSTVHLPRSSLRSMLPLPNHPTSLLLTYRQELLKTMSEFIRKRMSLLLSTYSPASLFRLHGTRTTTGGFTTTLLFPSTLGSMIPTSTPLHGKTTLRTCASSSPPQTMLFSQSAQLVITSSPFAWKTAVAYMPST